jgi:hypothetical protein
MVPDKDPDGSPGEIATDGNSVFWAYRNITADVGGVLSMPKSANPGTEPVDYALSAAASGVAVDETFVYWGCPVSGEVQRQRIDRSLPPETLATGQFGVVSLAVSADDVFWSLDTDGIRRAPKTSPNSVQELRPSQDPSWSFGEIVTDSTEVYWREGTSAASGGVWHWNPMMPVPTELVPNQQGPHGIALDDTHVYWVVFSPGTLLRAPKSPGGSVDILTYGEQSFDGVTVDDTAIFYTIWNTGKIMGIAK